MDVFGSQSDTETVDAVSEVSWQMNHHLFRTQTLWWVKFGRVQFSGKRSEVGTQSTLGRIYSRRATVMRSSPQFLRGLAIRVAMKEITHGVDDIDERRQIRGWKLFFLLPRLLLFRPHRGGNLPKKNLEERFRMFIEGRWVQLLIDSEACEAASSLATRRRRRNFSDTIDRRAERAQNLVLMGESLQLATLWMASQWPQAPRGPSISCPTQSGAHQSRTTQCQNLCRPIRRRPPFHVGQGKTSEEFEMCQKGCSSRAIRHDSRPLESCSGESP